MVNPVGEFQMTRNVLRVAAHGLLFAVLILGAPPLQAQDKTKPPKPPVITASPGKGVPTLSEKLDRNLNEIQLTPGAVFELIEPMLPPPPKSLPNPVYSTWVGVSTFDRVVQPGGERPGVIQFEGTEIHILNPGLTTAAVSCTFFSNGGTLLLDSGSTQAIGRGAKGFCSMGAEINSSLSGWVIVSADQPILVDGYQERRISRDNNASLTLYPVDCTDPTGLEFVCQFVDN